MGKIKVQDLAKRMGVAEQDLLFKLKSIGVRVDEQDLIDSSVIQAILEGKRLPQPREVILRDEEAKATAPSRRRPPPRRMPPSPHRPGRRRPMIQKVEPRIKTIPVTTRPLATAVSPVKPAATQASSAVAEPIKTKDVLGRHRPIEHGVPEKKEKKKRLGKPVAEPTEDLRVYRGAVRDLDREEDLVQPPAAPTSRGRRRAERKRSEGDEARAVVPFKDAAPDSPVTITEGMTVRGFADKLGVKVKDLMAMLMQQGLMVTINHVLDPETAKRAAENLGVEAMIVSFEQDVQIQQKSDLVKEAPLGSVSRAPVVTIMGHVDHGKTTLLDAIRSSRITASEFGGITQHIGAYQVDSNGRKIVFLDTPGHEAFTTMRARGAKVTDLVVLVVAADDGVMPQTIEAIDHARAANVPIIVAINKTDKPDANPDRVKKELADHELTVEDWGGDVVAVPISALKIEGVSELLEMILLNTELLELKANPELPAQGFVLEAKKEAGRGIVATVLVQNGTLRNGDVFVAGATWGRVRSMIDDLGERLDEAEPATPVEVTGFGEVPEAGDPFQIVEEESKARSIAEFRQLELRQRELAPGLGKASLEQLFERIQRGDVKELRIVLKADVQGSVEVLRETLHKLSTDQVGIRILRAGVGAINTNDVTLSSASGAIILGFNIRPERNAAELAEKEQVDMRLHTVIYEVSDEIRKAMTGLLEPTYKEVSQGRAEVREIFNVPRIGTVAGCHVVEGFIQRNSEVRLLRDNVVLFEGKIASLRRFKDDSAEVRAGFDCGMRLERYQDLKPGDTIEAFVQEEVAPTL